MCHYNSYMRINLNNIEELIFQDKEAQKLLPEFTPNFDQWRLAQRVPGLKQMGRRSIIQVLNSFTVDHIEALEKYFDDFVVLDSIDQRLVVNKTVDLEELESELCEVADFQEFCIYRDSDQVRISFWR